MMMDSPKIKNENSFAALESDDSDDDVSVRELFQQYHKYIIILFLYCHVLVY